MRRSQPFILLLGLLLTSCASKTAENAPPKSVKITLYAYPHDWPHDLPLKKPSELALRELTRDKALYSSTLDLSRGIPISSFAPQHRTNARMVALLHGHSITHVADDLYLSYLPRPIYHEVGWIDWFLIHRDQNHKAVEIIAERQSGMLGQKKSLITQARDGDEIIGAWGF